MKENYLLKFFEKKFSTVNNSYHESFKGLSTDELIGLCKHELLLVKVHKELKSTATQADLDAFSLNLQVFQHSGEGKDFENLYTSVFKKETISPPSFMENIISKQNETVTTTSQDFLPIFTKLAEKSGKDSWGSAHDCLFRQTGAFNRSAVECLVDGFALEKVTLYERFFEAVETFASFVCEIWTSTDFFTF